MSRSEYSANLELQIVRTVKAVPAWQKPAPVRVARKTVKTRGFVDAILNAWKA